MGELTQQLAEFDDWFYWINAARQLQIYRADRNSAFPITMRDDGRVQGRRPTDLEFRWPVDSLSGDVGALRIGEI